MKTNSPCKTVLMLCILFAGVAGAVGQDTSAVRRAAGESTGSGSGAAALTPLPSSRPTPRVTLDTSGLVDLPAWGTNAVALVRTWYPRIAELLGDPPSDNPPAIRLVIEEGKGVAATSGNRITVFAGWVRAHPEDVGLVVHELVHVVQAYPSPEPGWLTEGLADYIRFWHFESTPQTRIDKDKAAFRDSYRTTGAFLAWLEKEHPGTVKRLHGAMRMSAYQDSIFGEATGKSVQDLWKEFIAQWKDS
jgi:hypothetical protein